VTGCLGKPHPEKGQIGKYKVARLLPGKAARGK